MDSYRKQINQGLMDFLKESPTAYHAVDKISKILDDSGYLALEEGEEWNIEPGGSYYVTRNGSSILCFTLGNDLEDYNFQIAAAHTDSPTFKIKENAELHMTDRYSKLNTEGYGGMICSSWMDRPLSVAGRVLVREAGSVVSRLLTVDRDLLMIPHVAIHMNRQVNDGYAFNKQVDMLPLYAAGSEEGSFRKLIAEELSVEEEDILASDLFLYNRMQPTIWGLQEEFISGPHLDDLQCVYVILQALRKADHRSGVNMAAFFDNEEVGSGTKQGADSTFLSDVLYRISLALDKTESEHMRALASSFMISADNAHAVHPNHPEHTDQNNHNYMNAGVVVKSHAGQKYTSDGMSIAVIRELAHRAEVPLQYFANRSDKNGGSTLGNISGSHVSIPTVDLGLPQLAMHSSYETAGSRDTAYMIRLLEEFYERQIRFSSRGFRII